MKEYYDYEIKEAAELLLNFNNSDIENISICDQMGDKLTVHHNYQNIANFSGLMHQDYLFNNISIDSFILVIFENNKIEHNHMKKFADFCTQNKIKYVCSEQMNAINLIDSHDKNISFELKKNTTLEISVNMFYECSFNVRTLS